MKRLNRLARARPGQMRAASAVPAASECDIVVEQVGARGDGLASAPGGGPIYVPYALPGERASVRLVGDRAEVLALLDPSAERQAAPCAQFGRCGGCQLQHWREAPYLAWKREEVVRALARRGVEVEVAPIIPAWGEGRRRAGLHAAREAGAVRLGFVARGGAELIDVARCPVLAPALERAIPALLDVARIFAPQRGEMVMQCLASEAGIDVALKGLSSEARLEPALLSAAARVAEEADLARLSIDEAPLVTRRTPQLIMGGAVVSPPPGAFVQPTALGEAVLARLVLEGVAGAERVIDLFSGLGTFALRLAGLAPVHAVDSGASLLATLQDGANVAPDGRKKVTTLRRDLLRAPMSALELKTFDTVVMDPPRSGARRQAEQIGASKAQRVVMVSCDPGAFARDARILIDAGFRLGTVTPVDQFRWSPHIEVVGVLSR